MKKIRFKSILTTTVLAALFIGGWFLFNSFEKNSTYQTALYMIENGETENAWMMLSELRDYKDSEALAADLLERDPKLPYWNLNKGDLVTFGHWEQDNDVSNGPEPISWIVLDRIEGQLLLLSESVLDGGAYHDESFAEITWENCLLRSRLNSGFLAEAFTETERDLIPLIQNLNEDQSAAGTEGGNPTFDRIFLLSETEISIYLNEEYAAETIGRASATEYAKTRQIEVSENGYVSWWLRSPGVYPYSAQFVDQDGNLHLSGAYVDIDYQFGIRPALWLDISG